VQQLTGRFFNPATFCEFALIKKPEIEAAEEAGEMIGYARVSTIEQSLRLQVDAMIRAGVPQANIFVEKMSGARADRPVLRQSLKMLRPGWKLVFWKLDRVARSLSHLIKISDDVRDRGASLHSLTEQIDTSTAIGALYFHMLGAFAQFERDLTVQRTKAGMQALRETGRTFGRTPVLTDPKKREAVQKDLDAKGKDGVYLYTVAEVAKRNKISTGSLNNYFRAYRTKVALGSLRGKRSTLKPKKQ
jgi:serine recombinase